MTPRIAPASSFSQGTCGLSTSLAQRQLAAVAAIVVVSDVLTKQMALAMLPPPGLTVRVIGEYARFSLAFNRGAAFGMSVGPWSRVVFSVFALAMVAGLWIYAGRLFASLSSHPERAHKAWLGLAAEYERLR